MDKAEELTPEQFIIERGFVKQEVYVRVLMEQYANKKVLEALEGLEDFMYGIAIPKGLDESRADAIGQLHAYILNELHTRKDELRTKV